MILALVTSAKALFPNKATASSEVSGGLDIAFFGRGHNSPHCIAPQLTYKTGLSSPPLSNSLMFFLLIKT